MLGGGHLRGWKLSTEQVDALASALSRLASSEAMEIKYGLGGVARTGAGGVVVLFKIHRRHQARAHRAVGLGALDVNDGLGVGIHRVVFGVDPEKLIAAFLEFYPNAHEGPGVGHTIA